MRGGALPPALLCAVLGLFLAYAPRRLIGPALGALLIASVAVLFIPINPTSRLEEAAFIGCWLSVIATSAAIHLPDRERARLTILLGLNAGVWAGAVIATAGAPTDLAIALPWALLFAPALFVMRTPLRLAVKIAASWLAAVAILAAALPLTPTAGYEPDHMS